MNLMVFFFLFHGGTPENGFMENPVKLDDDWGYPYFRKPTYGGFR